MSKVLEATCSAGVVTVDDLPVPSATILSQGIKDSSGIAIIDEDKVTYVTSNASDIKDLITNLVAIIEQIVTIASGLDGVTVSPGSNAASIAALTLLKTSLDLTKDALK